MKVSSAVFNENYGKPSKKALLPLVPVKAEEVPSNQTITHTLRSNPAEEDGSKYKLQINILQGDEDCRTVLNWGKNARKVLIGLGIDEHHPAIPVLETLMDVTPRAAFHEGLRIAKERNMEERIRNAANNNQRNAIRNNGIDHQDNIEYDQISEGIDHVVQSLLPRQILARVKRFVRRECRKPMDMKVRKYISHLLRINNDELPRLPPFEGNEQKFSTDEMLDIILFGTPKSWQKEMERQGFDPMEHSVSDVVEFMERIESTEDFDADKNTKSVAKKGNKGDGKGKKSSGNGKSEYFCLYHGKNSSHNTDDCHKMINDAKRLKQANGNGDGKSNGKYGNKTWSRKADEAKKATNKDLASFIRKEIKKGVKDLKAFSKKRKSSDDESGSDGEVMAFDLKDFNYQDMENLKIDDDDSILEEYST